jgi:hypothetical protein
VEVFLLTKGSMGRCANAKQVWMGASSITGESLGMRCQWPSLLFNLRE